MSQQPPHQPEASTTTTGSSPAAAAPMPVASHIGSSNRLPTAVSSASSIDTLGAMPSPQQNTPLIVPPSGNSTSILPNTNTVPEFLYQLTKMLTDSVNRDVIEWSNGKIEVHNPTKLQNHILNKYFRHSKFASFQRQLNYFGFRKLAGKGKMAPCSYVNDATSMELSSLLTIKRKQTGAQLAQAAQAAQQQSPATAGKKRNAVGDVVNPILAGIVMQQQQQQPKPANNSQRAIAKVAVGKGIRHGYTMPSSGPPPPVPVNFNGNTIPASTPAVAAAPAAAAAVAAAVPTPQITASSPVTARPTPVQASLSALAENYQSSLQQVQTEQQPPQPQQQSPQEVGGFIHNTLKRDDSLINLAMIPEADDSGNDGMNTGDNNTNGLTFIDFPWLEPSPPSSQPSP